ncbi:TetR/AcrR family transcriptional regulator [Subtercola lobariae]|uniref:TetR family transcriptional regulator n=1 Tax=Subtercola lobariae TaxID=1588641 RepID=A0A917EVH6_9MICO|nr:TetR-like C-terminal domain-containing protein [Subtercola lobariae]GGF18083.1 TetR family transcriptional regulator [Subtercola lobariae]
MTDTARKRNPRGSGDLLREEILVAAITLIDTTDDTNALTLRGVARQASISAPSIYSHFDNLTLLVEAVLQSSFHELAESVRTAMAAEQQPAAKLLAAGRAYVDFGWQHKARYRLMFAETGYAENAVETFALVAESLQRCIDAGISGSTDARADTWIVWAALHGVATLDKPARADYLRLGALDRPALLETIIRRLTLIHGPPALAKL